MEYLITSLKAKKQIRVAEESILICSSKTPENQDLGDIVRKVCIQVDLRDKMNHLKYFTIVPLGHVNNDIRYNEVDFQKRIRMWFQSVNAVKIDRHYIYFDWIIPENQNILLTVIPNGVWFVDLARSLGVSNWSLLQNDLCVIDYNITITTVPRGVEVPIKN